MNKEDLIKAIDSFVEDEYNMSENRDLTASDIAEAVSKAIVHYHGKGHNAENMLNMVSYKVQAYCNKELE